MAISKIGSDALAAGAPSRSQLPAGTVLQVVNNIVSGSQSTTSTSYAATNVTASITPTSATSKVLVLVNCADPYKAANGGVCLRLYRNTTTYLTEFAVANAYTSTSMQSNTGSIGTCYLDSPASTSSTTYTVFIAAYTAGISCAIGASGSYSTITLMEIAQ